MDGSTLNCTSLAPSIRVADCRSASVSGKALVISAVSPCIPATSAGTRLKKSLMSWCWRFSSSDSPTSLLAAAIEMAATWPRKSARMRLRSSVASVWALAMIALAFSRALASTSLAAPSAATTASRRMFDASARASSRTRLASMSAFSRAMAACRASSRPLAMRAFRSSSTRNIGL